MKKNGPKSAMVLAAGLGTRLRPLTNNTPKPLVKVAGQSIIDYGLDKLAAAGVETAVINVHYLAEQIHQHLAARMAPRTVISAEPDGPLETGGGTKRALPLLGASPFLLINGDSFWVEENTSNIDRMIQVFDQTEMDMLLLLAPIEQAVGYAGRGDFDMAANGQLSRRIAGESSNLVYAGAAVVSPAVFSADHGENFSFNLLFDDAIGRGRLFGAQLEGLWLHISTPPDVERAEIAIRDRAAKLSSG